MRHLLFTTVAFAGCVCSLSSIAHAQKSTASLEKSYHDSKSKPYVVKKYGLDNSTERHDRIIGDFDTKEAARAAADKLNSALKGDEAYQWDYWVLPRSKEQDADGVPSELPPGSVITLPKLKIVDPGGSANSNAEATANDLLDQLKGKSGKGKIANVEVTITFQEDGTVVFSGKISGKGKLKVVKGQLIIETDNATYTIRTDGNSVFGLRTAKNNPIAKAKWEVLLETKPVEKARQEDDTDLYYLQDSNHYADGSPANASGWYTPGQSGIKLSVARQILKENKENVRKNKANKKAYTKHRIVDRNGKVIEE